MSQDKDTTTVRSRARPQATARRIPAGCRLTEKDLEAFAAGSHFRLHDRLGAHLQRVDGRDGTSFAVWAPNAAQVSVVGDFNGWNGEQHPLTHISGAGIWAGFVPGIGNGTLYKYRIASRVRGYNVDKADPFAFRSEIPPNTASIVWDLEHEWRDAEWMSQRAGRLGPDAPVSIYELHLGSWRRPADDPGSLPGYRALAEELVPYLDRMGFSHVEFLPLTEHPYYGSWGYQTTGYFSATSRYGSPQDLMFLVDELHRAGIGVIFDWVPSHFPTDEHGLGYFDGTHLFEHADPRQGYHPDWTSSIFNYGRPAVRSFLLSSAMFWLERYHVDGLRVDAVASMLYRDYSRKEGEWIPNKYGGRENLEAIDFLRSLNDTVHDHAPGVKTIAEESTAWPMVSRPTYLGGLGFDMKWDMGWMHDTLEYFALDPIHRRYHQDKLTFRMLYAFSENFVLPLSHDEVVHGKGSLAAKMFGDTWQRFANLRTLYGYMYAQSGKKLLFMGSELGPWREWNHEQSLEWSLTDHEHHAGLQRWIADLNRTYRAEPALHELDFATTGFTWIDCTDAENSVLALTRHPRHEGAAPLILILGNFTPVARHNYRVGVPLPGTWRELLNSDAEEYGGSGQGNLGAVQAVPIRYHGQTCSLLLTLPPLSVVMFRHDGETPVLPATDPED